MPLSWRNTGNNLETRGGAPWIWAPMSEEGASLRGCSGKRWSLRGQNWEAWEQGTALLQLPLRGSVGWAVEAGSNCGQWGDMPSRGPVFSETASKQEGTYPFSVTAFQALLLVPLIEPKREQPAKETCGLQSPSSGITEWSEEAELGAKPQYLSNRHTWLLL